MQCKGMQREIFIKDSIELPQTKEASQKQRLVIGHSRICIQFFNFQSHFLMLESSEKCDFQQYQIQKLYFILQFQEKVQRVIKTIIFRLFQFPLFSNQRCSMPIINVFLPLKMQTPKQLSSSTSQNGKHQSFLLLRITTFLSNSDFMKIKNLILYLIFECLQKEKERQITNRKLLKMLYQIEISKNRIMKASAKKRKFKASQRLYESQRQQQWQSSFDVRVEELCAHMLILAWKELKTTQNSALRQIIVQFFHKLMAQQEYSESNKNNIIQMGIQTISQGNMTITVKQLQNHAENMFIQTIFQIKMKQPRQGIMFKLQTNFL